MRTPKLPPNRDWMIGSGLQYLFGNHSVSPGWDDLIELAVAGNAAAIVTRKNLMPPKQVTELHPVLTIESNKVCLAHCCIVGRRRIDENAVPIHRDP